MYVPLQNGSIFEVVYSRAIHTGLNDRAAETLHPPSESEKKEGAERRPFGLSRIQPTILPIFNVREATQNTVGDDFSVGHVPSRGATHY